ncbi:hybrid sensor histidine kinase/response regulator [Phocaeicola sp.]
MAITNNPRTLRSLQLKMIIGYTVIISLFLLVLLFVYREKQNLTRIATRAKELQEKRQLADNTTVQILDLALLGEQMLAWEEEEFALYSHKRDTLTTLLYKLREQLPDTAQRKRINAIIELLPLKEKYIFATLDDLQKLRDTYTLLQERIPILIHANKKQQEKLTQEIRQNYEEDRKKTGGFLGLFRSTKKSRYLTERENHAALLDNQSRTDTRLRSLANEIDRTRMEGTELLFAHLDSLSTQNTRLNRQMCRLITDFNRASQTIQQQTSAVYMQGQKRALRTISSLGFCAVLLAFLFYRMLQKDLKKRHKMRMELEVSNRRNEALLRARKNMMLTVSHDLRSPLTAIGGYAELIADERRKEKRIRYSETICQSTERMLNLLNALLRFYRLDTGKEQSNPAPFRLKALAESLVPNYVLQAENKRLAFTWEYCGDDVVVTGDRERLSQIIDNLLSNAVKFTQAGAVSLRLDYRDALLAIEVKDTGTGMTDRQLQQIFQPFERLGHAGGQEGFGLGLAITLATAELLEGSVRVESEKGKGSTFTVCVPLPVTDEENPIPKAGTPCALPDDLHIAVVDDDPVLLAMTMDMLSRHKIACEGCRNVRDLMELLRKQPCDLLITDIKMPDMNGYQLLELLRRSNVGNSKTIPVLAATACAERNTEEFTKAGFAGCLYKPFSQAELLYAVQECIRLKQIPAIPVKADFSALLAGERNNREMLELFADETSKNMEALEACIGSGDLKMASFLTHHLLPLGELVRECCSLKNLQRLLDASPGTMDGETVQAIRKVVEEGNSVVRQARALIEELKEE